MNHKSDPRTIFAREFYVQQDKIKRRQKIYFAIVICSLTIINIVVGTHYHYLAALAMTALVPLASIVMIVLFSSRNSEALDDFYDKFDSMNEEDK